MQRLLSFRIGVACLLLAAGCTSHQENRDVSKSHDLIQTAGIQPTGGDGTEPQTTDGVFKVRFQTTKGDFVVRVDPSWAPHGAARFRGLVEAGFYDDCRFFRVVPKFMVQWGINGNPKIQDHWQDRNLPDDPPRQSNTKGRVTFAKTDNPNSRSTQVFISYEDNSFLDRQGFAPFGEIVEGWAIVGLINAEHGEKPEQGLIQSVGNGYLDRNFPNLDYIESAKIVE